MKKDCFESLVLFDQFSLNDGKKKSLLKVSVDEMIEKNVRQVSEEKRMKNKNEN